MKKNVWIISAVMIGGLLSGCATQSTSPVSLVQGKSFSIPVYADQSMPPVKFTIIQATLSGNSIPDDQMNVESNSDIGREILSLARLQAEEMKPLLVSLQPPSEKPLTVVGVNLEFQSAVNSHTATNVGRMTFVIFTLGIGSAFVNNAMDATETITVTVLRSDGTQKKYISSRQKDFSSTVSQTGFAWASAKDYPDKTPQIIAWEQPRIELRQDCAKEILDAMRANSPVGAL